MQPETLVPVLGSLLLQGFAAIVSSERDRKQKEPFPDHSGILPAQGPRTLEVPSALELALRQLLSGVSFLGQPVRNLAWCSCLPQPNGEIASADEDSPTVSGKCHRADRGRADHLSLF